RRATRIPSTTCSRCSPTSLPGSWRSPMPRCATATTCSRSRAPASTRSSSARATSPRSSVVPSPRSESTAPGARRWRTPVLALGAILALAAALRAVGVQYGLPFGLLNPDEQSIVPLAWRIAHSHSPNPHGFFDYPTLVPELMAPFQAWQGSPSFLAGRIVVLVL